MKRFAILIGTEEYEDFTPTAFCHNDAQLLYKTLTENCDYAKQDVLLKKLSPADNVTPSLLLGEISDIISRSQDGDTVVFFYAGHGDYYNDESYLILPNTKANNKERTALPIRDITEILSRNKRLNIRIFDTCHSGQDTRRSANVVNSQGFTRTIMAQKIEGAITFASCKEDEFSYSSPAMKQGVFTNAFVNSLMEIEENKNVYPETIKLSVCDKVASWAQENTVNQTPTYISFVSGNVDFATRKPVIIPSVSQNLKLSETLGVQNRSVTDRISNLKLIPMIGGLEHNELLEKGISNIREKITKTATSDLFCEADIQFSEPLDPIALPTFILPRIVSLFNKERPLHTIKHEKKYKGINDDVLPGMAGIPSRLEHMLLYGAAEKVLVSQKYIVEQPHNMPNSVILGEIDSDGYIPKSGMIFYLVPLQLTVALVSGHYIDSSFTNEPVKPQYSDFSKRIMAIDELQTNIVDIEIKEAIDRFSKALMKEVDGRLNYLEWEIEQSHPYTTVIIDE